MAERSIASLNLSFGLVSIPVKLYSATESAAAIKFNLLAKDGSRVKQQYVSEKDQSVVARADMVKGYEIEKDKFVLFSADELEQLEQAGSHVVDIVAFVPEKSVDPRYYDKAYLLAPDKRGGKPYALLQEAMRVSGQSALARWSWKARQYVVQVRPTAEGLVLQQLLYAEEVRSFKELAIEPVAISAPELKLALQLIDQISAPAYEPDQFKDEEKARILAAIDAKIAGQEVVASTHRDEPALGAQVIDLMAALQASLQKKPAAANKTKKGASNVSALPGPRLRSPAKPATAAVAEGKPAPGRARARK